MALDKPTLTAAFVAAFQTAYDATADPAASRQVLASALADAIEDYVQDAYVTVLVADVGLQTYVVPPGAPIPTTGPVAPILITGGLS